MEIKKMSLLVKDLDERLIEGWANVELKDLQGDVVPVDAMKKAMIKYVERGGPINYRHTNHVIGKVLSFWVDEKDSGVQGVKILAKIYRDDELMDKAWEEVQKGDIKGFSIGGVAVEKDGDVLKTISIHEISLVEKPANPEAVIEAYTIAKGEEVEKDGCKDRYMADSHNFKEMSCPGKSDEKSKFCGCVRYQMSCNGKSEESARKICAAIYHAKYGGEDDVPDVEGEVEKETDFDLWGNMSSCVDYLVEEENYSEDVAERICHDLKNKMADKSYRKAFIRKMILDSVDIEKFKYDDDIRIYKESGKVEGKDVKPKVDDEPVLKEEENTENEEVTPPAQGKMDILLQTMAEINDKLSQLLEKFNAVASPPTEEKSEEKEEEDKEDEDEKREDEVEEKKSADVAKELEKSVPNFVKVETPVSGVEPNEVENDSVIKRLLKGEIDVDTALKEVKGGR